MNDKAVQISAEEEQGTMTIHDDNPKSIVGSAKNAGGDLQTKHVDSSDTERDDRRTEPQPQAGIDAANPPAQQG